MTEVQAGAVLTAAQMRGIESAAMARGAVTGLALMERAGAGVVAAILEQWPEMRAAGLRAVVLCGAGNNGGDGYVIARLLAKAGWQVRLCALGAPATPDAEAMRALWSGEVCQPSDMDWDHFRTSALVVDAMFGTGLARDIAPGVWGLLEMAKASGCRLVAVDILSGICADTGRVRAEGGYLDAPADLTVTFQCPKLGHYLGEGGQRAGRLVVVPLGLEAELAELMRADGAAVVELSHVTPAGLGKGAGHKFSHGHAVIVSGGHGRAGAARLAARGALRIGAGLVTVASPAEAMAESAARLDAVMLRQIVEAGDLAEMLADGRIGALCLGPGMGLGERQADLVAVALGLESRGGTPTYGGGAGVGVVRESGWNPDLRALGSRYTVLDADALTLLARGADLFAALHRGCVLTPHAGEFARLFPDLAARMQADPGFSKVDATRAASARTGAVVLFKGADTVIAAPDGRVDLSAALYDRAAPWLATAGSGDVLAGFITGLLARGWPPFEAASTAAWLHVEAARNFGPGLIAEDLPEELPKVLRAMGV